MFCYSLHRGQLCLQLKKHNWVLSHCVGSSVLYHTLYAVVLLTTQHVHVGLLCSNQFKIQQLLRVFGFRIYFTVVFTVLIKDIKLDSENVSLYHPVLSVSMMSSCNKTSVLGGETSSITVLWSTWPWGLLVYRWESFCFGVFCFCFAWTGCWMQGTNTKEKTHKHISNVSVNYV